MGSHIKSFQGKLRKGKMWKLLICVWLWTIVCDGVPHHKSAKTFNIFPGTQQLKTMKRQQPWNPKRQQLRNLKRQQLRIAIFLSLLSGLSSALLCGTPMILRSVKVRGVCHAQNQSGPQPSSASNQKAWCLGDVSLAMLESDSVTIVWER